jgi:hypothetical protein
MRRTDVWFKSRLIVPISNQAFGPRARCCFHAKGGAMFVGGCPRQTCTQGEVMLLRCARLIRARRCRSIRTRVRVRS